MATGTTHHCCPSCRLRFTPAAQTYLTSCPECGRSLIAVDGAAELIGFCLFDPADMSAILPAVGEAAIRPEPNDGWS